MLGVVWMNRKILTHGALYLAHGCKAFTHYPIGESINAMGLTPCSAKTAVQTPRLVVAWPLDNPENCYSPSLSIFLAGPAGDPIADIIAADNLCSN